MNTDQIYEIERIKSEAIRLDLNGIERVSDMAIDELKMAYNGTGPEFLPDVIRKKLDDICSPFLPAVMVHDVDFTLSDGTVRSFNEANNRLLINCMTCATDAAPWTSWKRYTILLEAFAIYRACHKFGWTAWLSAYRKNNP